MSGGPMLALLGVTVTLSLAAADCRLDQALVTHVPPATIHVVTVSECGGITCWERWVETDGKRLGVARVCTGENGKFEAAPLP
jgi:hypothetical protein